MRSAKLRCALAALVLAGVLAAPTQAGVRVADKTIRPAQPLTVVFTAPQTIHEDNIDRWYSLFVQREPRADDDARCGDFGLRDAGDLGSIRRGERVVRRILPVRRRAPWCRGRYVGVVRIYESGNGEKSGLDDRVVDQIGRFEFRVAF